MVPSANTPSSWGHVNPIGPRACYDEGKRVAETLTYGFHRQDGVDVRVARIFNTYGTSSLFLNLPLFQSSSVACRLQDLEVSAINNIIGFSR